MTQFSPTLAISRLLVTAKGQTALDIEFHQGLNIISGENSSGKSTIMDFLFFGLGGEITDWRERALECDSVFLEVQVNSRPATLHRSVSTKARRPMRIFEGAMKDALNSVVEGWREYPFISSSKESFSQVMFAWMNLPKAASDENSSITMHQVLRLLYADQISPIDRIFRAENFDKGIIRQAVGDLLCGAFDDRLYQAKMRLREAENEYSEVSNKLSSIFSALGSFKHSLTPDWLDSERKNLRSALELARKELQEADQAALTGGGNPELSLKDQDEAYESVRNAQLALQSAKERADQIALEMADSGMFIKALEKKLTALRDAEATHQALGSLQFTHCPSCYAPLEALADHECVLCKTELDEDRVKGRTLAMIADITLQLKQSRQAQSSRENDHAHAQRKVETAYFSWQEARNRYAHAVGTPSSELNSRAREAAKKVGYLERQIADLDDKAELVNKVADLSEKKEALAAEKSRLQDTIQSAERAQLSRIQRAYTLIAENTKRILRKDLERQDTFHSSDKVTFDFTENRVSVEGESFFSASSMVYLKNAFLTAFLAASLQDKNFRHPRLLMLDTVEDKGMEPERSHNFQRVLQSLSADTDVEHQIIIATAMIAPELAATPLVAGRYLTHERRSLSIPVS